MEDNPRVDAAWIALVGSLGGVLVGGILTLVLDQIRWRREERSRWYRERRQLYSEFLQAAEHFRSVIAESHAAGRKPPEQEPMDDAGRRSVGELRRLRSEIALIGGTEVRAEAERLRKAIDKWMSGPADDVPRPPRYEQMAPGYQQMALSLARFAELERAFDEFREVARSELGVVE